MIAAPRWSRVPHADPDSVVGAELWHLGVPLRRAHHAAHGALHQREVVLVALHGADGVVGWGECDALDAPTYTGEWIAGAWWVLVDHLLPAWWRGEASKVRGHPMACAALRCAAVDLALRRRGQGLAAALGAARSEVARGTVVSGTVVDDVVAAADAAVHDGAALVKVKIRPGATRDLLAAVRGVVGDLPLAADANGSFDRRTWAELDVVDELGLTYLEQPLPAEDLVGHADLARRLSTPLALDESASSVGALRSAVALGAASAVNVKPARVGGITEAMEMADVARGAGLDVFVGGMVELAIGRACAVAVAASELCTLPTDLGPSAQYVARDIGPPVEVGAGGGLVVPTGPGIGTAPDAAALARAVRHRRLHP